MNNQQTNIKCNRDCFCCPYEDCILDENDISFAEYLAENDIEELLFPKTQRQKKIAAYGKAYYEANKEKFAARNKAYREDNKEKIAAYKKAYYEANKEKIAAYKKAYYEAKKRVTKG